MVNQKLNKDTIVVMTSGFPRSKNEGLNTFVLEYCKSLTPFYKVVVIAPKDGNSLAKEKWDNIDVYRHRQSVFSKSGVAYGNGILPNIRNNPLLIFSLPSFFIFQYLLLKKIIGMYQPTFVNCHWIVPQGTTLRFYQLFNKTALKTIGTVHGSDFWKMNSWPLLALRNFSYRNLDLLVGVSEPLKKMLAETFPNQIVRYIPVGINTNTFHPSKTTHDSFNILFVGNIIEEKGVLELLEAMVTVVKFIPECHLKIIGEGKLTSRLKEMVDKYGISNHLTFTGMVHNEELPVHYSKADLFCLPSYSEGYPIVLKEAMSCGLNCLVSELPVYLNNTHLREILYFSAVKNSHSLATKIVEIYRDQDREMRRIKARKYMEETADWGVLALKTEEEFEKLKR